MVTGWPNLSSDIDSIFLIIVGICVVLLIAVTAVMVYFVIRYRRSRNPKAEDIAGNMTLEILWTVIPTLIVLVIFYVGWKGFVFLRTVPDDAMPVKVTARMWSWSFEYENGRTSDVLKLPLGRPVKLSITSLDVLHSLYIPAFRVKEDAVPGMGTFLWFRPDETGSYDLFCTEYCGVGHSSMITKVEVMQGKEFLTWYEKEKRPAAGAKKAPMKEERTALRGAMLAEEKGCTLCHSLDGSKLVGPTFRGIFGRNVIVMASGTEREITTNEEYLRRSIFEPNADVVKSYPAIMPSQRGILSDDDVKAIIEYLKTLK